MSMEVGFEKQESFEVGMEEDGVTVIIVVMMTLAR